MRSKKLWWIAGALGVLTLIAAVVLPLVVDVNRYRGLIESRARQTLGRDVRLGDMKLSLLPVLGVRVDDVTVGALPAEGGGDLLTAKRVRVGARFLPLLQRRLEVTSIVIQQPRMTLARGRDGTWNVERLFAEPADAAAGSTGTSSAFSVDLLRLKNGRITVRDEGQKSPIELTFVDFDLELSDVAPDRPIAFELATSIDGLPGSRLRLDGQAGPLVPTPGKPTRVSARIDLAKLDPARLVELARAFASVPPDLVGSRTSSIAMRLEAELVEPARIALSDVRVSGLELRLRRTRDGRWNLPTAGEGTASGGGAAPELSVERLKLSETTLHLRDEASTPPLEVTLAGLSLSLDRLPSAGPAALDLTTGVEAASGRGKLSARGKVGPTSAASPDLPVELKLTASAIPLELLRVALPADSALDTRQGTAGLEATVSGQIPRRVDLAGSLSLADARVAAIGPDGKARALPLDLQARYDLTAFDAGAGLDLRRFDLTIGKNALPLRGNVRTEGSNRRLDLRVGPASWPASDLAALAALVLGELPVSIASTTPVEIEAHVHGLSGADRLPAIDGGARLSDVTLHHASMTRPLERLRADVTLRGEQVELTNLSGTVGSSDIAGQVTLTGFATPAVRFDLTAKRADFGELFSFLDDTDDTSGGAGDDALAGLTLDGRLRIDSGTFETLDFAALDATMDWRDGVATLDPLRMDLYGGSFTGRVTGDLREEQPAWQVSGDAQRVDVDAFLADNVGTTGLITGRFSGRLDTRCVGSDYEAIVRAMDGRGEAAVREGQLGRLDVLKTVSRVSGVFGETTLARLSKSLARGGTDFKVLASDVRLSGGRMHLDGLLLEALDFQLRGRAAVDLLTSHLDGDFRLILSREISDSMRAEKSRAGELFYSAKSQQVELPFTLSGPLDAPTPGIDFKSVARQALEDRGKDRLRDLVGERLGLSNDTPPEIPVQTAPAPDDAPAPGPPAAPSAALRAEILRTRWSGSVLARDLKIDGRASGAAIDRVALVVTDARGIEIRRWDRLRDVDEQLAAATDPSSPMTLTWRAEVDGKKLALAKFPVRVRATVVGSDGSTAETTLDVDR